MDEDVVVMTAQGDQLMCDAWDEFAKQSPKWRDDFQDFMRVMMENDGHAGFQLMAKFAAVGFTHTVLSRIEAEESSA